MKNTCSLRLGKIFPFLYQRQSCKNARLDTDASKLVQAFPLISVGIDSTPKRELIQMFAVDEIRPLVKC